jgi:hypothetical protein
MESMGSPQQRRRQVGMSYKFQRLREKIRAAVASGELSGKLPGERELARRFHVNAKTLSKALTDLASEGLLHRSIGRGTFVKGAAPSDMPSEGRWLLLADGEADDAIIRHIKLFNSSVEVTNDPSSLRPSYISQFSAVIDLAENTPDSFLRDLLVRNIPVVSVGREPRTYSTNAVLLDSVLGVSHLTRDLLMAGHRKFLAVEGRNRTTIAETIRKAATRFGAQVSVDACFPEELAAAMEYGSTAIICNSAGWAAQTMQRLADAGIDVPGRVSVAAIGCIDGAAPCTGYYVTAEQKAAGIIEVLKHSQSGRPITLWLTGATVDAATTHAGTVPMESEPAAVDRRLASIAV